MCTAKFTLQPPLPSLHQPFDEVVGVTSEEELSSCCEELQVERNTSCHKSLMFCCSAPSRGAEYCNEHVCLPIFEHISRITQMSSPPNILCMLPQVMARSSWLFCGMLCTFSLMDEVMFTHNGQEQPTRIRVVQPVLKLTQQGQQGFLIRRRIVKVTHRVTLNRDSD